MDGGASPDVDAFMRAARVRSRPRSAEPGVADYKHLGVATCATSVCHGKLAPQPGKNVALNEYRTWTQEDRHAQAYRTLELAESKRIAANLGLPSATTAKICLDCHADNVPSDKRGPKFQLSDGIGCEACHGGSEKWIESHAAESATHKDNVARGMYPTEQPLKRAQLCLGCHLGTKDRFATHAIMGAGHPRLSFELEAYTTNQPAHYIVDADYDQRKGRIEGMNLWLTGQIESARRMLTLLQTNMFHGGGMFPELAFYDCHSCHHPMDKIRWNAQRAGAGIKPGTLRLQTQNLIVLQAVTETFEPAALPELVGLTNAPDPRRPARSCHGDVRGQGAAGLGREARCAHAPPVLRCRRDGHAQDAGQVRCHGQGGRLRRRGADRARPGEPELFSRRPRQARRRRWMRSTTP